MSESKGLSLRKTKKSKKPAISAPRQISAPINATGIVPRPDGGPTLVTGSPRRPSGVGGKVCAFSERRFLSNSHRPLILSKDDTLPDSMLYQKISTRPFPQFLQFPRCQHNMGPREIANVVLRLVKVRDSWSMTTYCKTQTCKRSNM